MRLRSVDLNEGHLSDPLFKAYTETAEEVDRCFSCGGDLLTEMSFGYFCEDCQEASVKDEESFPEWLERNGLGSTIDGKMHIYPDTEIEALKSLVNTLHDKSAPITLVGVNWKEE